MIWVKWGLVGMREYLCVKSCLALWHSILPAAQNHSYELHAQNLAIEPWFHLQTSLLSVAKATTNRLVVRCDMCILQPCQACTLRKDLTFMSLLNVANVMSDSRVVRCLQPCQAWTLQKHLSSLNCCSTWREHLMHDKCVMWCLQPCPAWTQSRWWS